MADQRYLKNVADNCAKLILSSRKSGAYSALPFQHIVIDDFFPTSFAEACLQCFPDLSDPCWEHSDDMGIEVKSRTTWASEFDIPDVLVDAVRVSNSSVVLRAMSKALGIPKLMPDPYFTGGGLNASRRGGHLDVHVDGNYHDASGLNRRVNLLVYLTKGWERSWGGEFGLYGPDGADLVKSVEPIFNRCIIFDSHDKSYHGLPNPIQFPENNPRRSLILYYYTAAQRPNHSVTTPDPHSALWRSKGFLDKRGNKTRDYD